MIRLRRADLEAVLSFLGDIAELDVDEPYAPDVLKRLQELIPCEGLTYQEFEYRARRDWLMIAVDAEGAFRWEASSTEPMDAEGELYWKVGPCPIAHYRIRERDLGAIRMSDLIPRRRFSELPIYREYFREQGVDQMLDLGLPDRSPRQRSLVLFREEGVSDFSERDRDVLELLRTHLHHLETHAALRRRLAEALRESNGDADSSDYADLTPREREVAGLVAEGKTNAEIAAILWVAPSTVKKHLEHIYAKTGVGRRAAVAAARYATRG